MILLQVLARRTWKCIGHPVYWGYTSILEVTPSTQSTSVSASHLELLAANLADVLPLKVDLDHALFFQLVGVSLPRHMGRIQGESLDASKYVASWRATLGETTMSTMFKPDAQKINVRGS